MALTPRKTKYKKQFRGKNRGLSNRGSTLAFGSYGLKSMDAKWLTARQIEAARRTIIRYLKKGGRLWIRVFPDKPVTSKGVEFSLGGGKGSVDHYVCVVKPGRVVFELEGIKEDIAREAMRMAADKLPIKTKFIKK